MLPEAHWPPRRPQKRVLPTLPLALTPFKLPSLPQGAGTKKVCKEVDKDAIVDEWDKSSWAQVVQKRRALTDFGCWSVMLACFLASRES